MERADYLIIGGGIAGTAAAETIRKRNEQARILIVADEPHRLYSRVLLPRYLAGTLERPQLFLRPAAHYENQRIETAFGQRVSAVDPVERTVHCVSGESYTYGKLVIATGGSANQLSVAGHQLPGVHSFKTIDDADALVQTAATAHRVVVVGGGFIGLELIDALAQRGLSITVVIRETSFWPDILGEVGGALVRARLQARGVTIITNDQVSSFVGDQRVTGVKLASGAVLPTDVVGVGVGQNCIQPWFLDAGLTLTAGGIKTNERLETNLANVYAAGDVAAFYDGLADHHHRLGNWLNAQIHGTVVGINATGGAMSVRSVTLYRADHQGLTLLFIGDLRREQRQIVDRSERGGRFGRFFFRQGALVGAVLIDITDVIQPIQAAIQAQRPFFDPRTIRTTVSLKAWLSGIDATESAR